MEQFPQAGGAVQWLETWPPKVEDAAPPPLAGEFGAGDHTPLGLRFLFTVLVCSRCHDQVPSTGWLKQLKCIISQF